MVKFFGVVGVGWVVVVMLVSDLMMGVFGICNFNFMSFKVVVKEDFIKLVLVLVIFGDFIVDVGNNNYLIIIVKFDFWFYGMSFVGYVFIGCFMDGLFVMDYIC